MSVLQWLFEAQIQFGSKSITYREIIGGLLGLTSAVLLAMHFCLQFFLAQSSHLVQMIKRRIFMAKLDVTYY
jgi:hypothetical protein